MPSKRRKFDPVLTWLDSRKYKLSDRIWNVSAATAIQINALLEDAVNSGTASLSLAKQMEQFLLPGRHLPRTDKPYGTDASFNAMRLARTEITRSHSLANQQSALENPFVDRMKYHLSAAHVDDPGDICEEFAAESEANNGYPKDECPQPGGDSHPNCVTAGQLVETLRGAVKIEEITDTDYVLTHTGKYQKVVYVWNKQHSGVVYRIKTNTGILELTGEHPVLTSAGWLNADSLEIGDNILYTGKGAKVNLGFGVPESNPTQLSEPLITDSIMFSSMPVSAVSFNGDLDLRNGEVNLIAHNTKLSNIFDLELVKGVSQKALNSGFARITIDTSKITKAPLRVLWTIKQLLTFGANFVTAPSSGTARNNHTRFNFGIVHRVIQALGFGNFAPRFWTFASNSYLVFMFGIIFFHCFRSSFAPLKAIAVPLHSNSMRSVTQGDVIGDKQITKYTKGYAKQFEQFRRSMCGVCVPLIKNLCNRLVELLLKSECMILININSVCEGVGKGNAQHIFAANGAIMFHDNLSLLSLENVVGAASRNAVVSGVITPSQAHLYYSIVESLEQCQYDGLVYNMHVETDNSYTVNGAVVHNCICYTTSEVMPMEDAIALIRDNAGIVDDVDVFTDDRQRSLFEDILLGVAGVVIWEQLFRGE